MNRDQSCVLGLSIRYRTLLWGLVFSFVTLIFILSCNSNEPIKSISPKKKTTPIVTQVKYYKNYRIDDNGVIHYSEPINKEKALTSHHYRLHYDQKRIIKEEEFDKKGRLIRYSINRYEDGKKMYEEVYTGSKNLIFIRYYEANGVPAKEEKYSSGQIVKYINFIYNKGRKKQESHYRSDGILELFKTFKYNGKSQLIRVNTHRPQGKKSIVYQYIVYRYNEKGEKKKEQHFFLGYSPNTNSQKYLLIREYKYTSKGIQMTAIRYQDNKVVKKEKYLYNTQGEEIKPAAEESEDGMDENLKPNNSNFLGNDNKSPTEKSD